MTETRHNNRERKTLPRVAQIIIGTIVGAMLAIGLLYLAYFIWANFLTDTAFRQAQWEAGSMKVMISEFRGYYHGRDHYAPKSLEQLRQEGVISDDTFQFISSRSYRYIPISSDTPDDALVLRLGWPVTGDKFHKGDFSAAQSAPDIVIRK
jgi:hypothetical protein